MSGPPPPPEPPGSSPGFFGPFGGRFVAETLMPAVTDLAGAFDRAWADPGFVREYEAILRDYVGRPTPLSFAPRLSAVHGARIYLKREDLNHTGSHKINNCVGQVLLALRMGKHRIVAETGAGQHGVATATVCARFGLPCTIYMGAKDVDRQAPNVFRMEMLGARVVPVEAGTGTLKDAINEALRDWVTHVDDTHYVIGSVMGPDPYPRMVRAFHEVIGREARAQILGVEGRLPDAVVACVGGGSNAIGIFSGFLGDPGVHLFGVEAAGEGIATGRHAATMVEGRPGIFHGMRSLVLQDPHGGIRRAHSISAGLDYPGVGPEHAELARTGRATYLSARDDEALSAFEMLARLEGVVPALETAHAVARLPEVVAAVGGEPLVVVNASGRGDKDVSAVMARRGKAAAP